MIPVKRFLFLTRYQSVFYRSSYYTKDLVARILVKNKTPIFDYTNLPYSGEEAFSIVFDRQYKTIEEGLHAYYKDPHKSIIPGNTFFSSSPKIYEVLVKKECIIGLGSTNEIVFTRGKIIGLYKGN